MTLTLHGVRAQLERTGVEPRTVAVVAVLAVLAATSAWWAGRARELAAQRLIEGPAGADFYLLDLHSQTRDPEGRVVQRLRAKRLVHYKNFGDPPTGPAAVATQAGLERPRADGGVLTLTAAQGTFTDNNNTVHLAGDVKVRLLRQADATPITARMPSLDYDLRTERASTPAAVHIESGGMVMQGDGLDLDVASGRIGLAGRVRATLPSRSRP